MDVKRLEGQMRFESNQSFEFFKTCLDKSSENKTLSTIKRILRSGYNLPEENCTISKIGKVSSGLSGCELYDMYKNHVYSAFCWGMNSTTEKYQEEFLKSCFSGTDYNLHPLMKVKTMGTGSVTFKSHFDSIVLNSVFKEEVEKKNQFDLLGNQISIPIWGNIVNPLFKHEDNMKNNMYFNNNQIIDSIKKMNCLSDMYHLKDTNETYTFMHFLNGLYLEVLKSRVQFNNPEDFNRIAEFVNNGGIFNDMSSTFNNSITFPKVDVFVKLFSILPLILSPQYTYQLKNSVMSVILGSLTLLALKMVMDLAYKKNDKNATMLISSFYAEMVQVVNNFDKFSKIEDIVCNLKSLPEIRKYLDSYIPSLFKLICGKDFNGEDFSNSNRTVDQMCWFVDFCKQFDDVKWFDAAIFNVNSSDCDKDIKRWFSDSLLESSYIHLNCLGIRDFYPSEASKKLMDAHFFSGDYTGVINEEIPESDFMFSRSNSECSIFSAINLGVSLAFSIRVDDVKEGWGNIKDTFPIINSKMARPRTFLLLWDLYTKHLLDMSSYVMYSGTTKSEINLERDCFHKIKMFHYALYMRSWYIDGYYFWSQFDKTMSVTQKNVKQAMTMMVKFNDMIGKMFSNLTCFFLPYRAKSIITKPVAGSYLLTVFISCISEFRNNQNEMVGLVTYAMKDLFLNNRELPLIKQENNKFSFIQHIIGYHKALRNLKSHYIEKSLGNMIKRWTQVCVIDPCSTNETLKKYFEKEFGNNVNVNFANAIKDDLPFNNLYGETVLKMHLEEKIDHETLSIMSDLIYFSYFAVYAETGYISKYMIKTKERMGACILQSRVISKLNDFQITEQVFGNKAYGIVGEALCMFSDSRYSRNDNIIPSLSFNAFKDRCVTGLEDPIIFSCGLPIYSMYDHGTTSLFLDCFSSNMQNIFKYVGSFSNYVKTFNDLIFTLPELFFTNLMTDEDTRKKVVEGKITQVVSECINTVFSGVKDQEQSDSVDLQMMQLSNMYSSYNVEIMMKALVKGLWYSWGSSDLRKYIKDQMMERIKGVIELIGGPKNNIVDKVIEVKTKKYNVAHQKNEKHFDKLPAWFSRIYHRLSLQECTTEEGKKLKENLMRLAAWNAKNGCRFCHENIIDNYFLANKNLGEPTEVVNH